MTNVTVPPPSNPFPVTSEYVNGGLFWREDESLKQYLQGKHIVTFDQSSKAGGRLLKVYFRDPELEIRKREFPYIMIDRLGFERDPEREMRGPFILKPEDPYCPDGTEIVTPINGVRMVRRRIRGSHLFPSEGTYQAQDLPIPIVVRYQIQAWARFKQQILWVENQMVTVLPIRFGAIPMATSKFARDDDTVRRMDFLGVVSNEAPDPDNADKRVFARTWTVAISSEILPSDLGRTVGPLVGEVVVDPSDRPGYNSVTE